MDNGRSMTFNLPKEMESTVKPCHDTVDCFMPDMYKDILRDVTSVGYFS